MSITLLMVYTISFAHEVIPHCHHALGFSDGPHEQLMHHGHHDDWNQHHDDGESHVSHHQGHSQECLSVTDDLFCFLSCFLSETEHPGSEGDQHLLLPEDREQAIRSMIA